MRKALFLDRDGVLDELVYRADTGGFEAPRNAEEMRIRPGVREALQLAVSDGWLLFVVSNQPDVAKGRTSRESLDAAHRRLIELLGEGLVTEFFYCFHRAEDRCTCRKPEPRRVLEAAKTYDVDLSQSWFAGDVDTDVECGRRAGTQTALIEYEHSNDKRGNQHADLVCRDLAHLVRILTARKSDHAAQPED
jgi:D-glycero-D-manno-heptose 1,7-bisphosphate phosphatase